MVRTRYARQGRSTQNKLFGRLKKNATRLSGLASRKMLAVVAASGVLASPLAGIGNPANAAVNCSTDFAGGTGTSSDPWKVSTPAQLSALSTCGTAGKYFEQINDINLGSITSWVPIPSFSGSYNGQNFRITNLRIESSADFQALINLNNQNSLLTGINLVVNTVTGGLLTAALVVENRGSITASSVSGGSVTSRSTYAGAMAAINSGIIEKSWASTSVSVTNAVVGGLVGVNEGGKIIDSYATGAVTGQSSVGGLVGKNLMYDSTTTIKNSYSTGLVIGTSEKGGLVGTSLNHASFASGTTIPFTGKNFWDTTSSGQSLFGTSTPAVTASVVAGKTTAEMKSFSTFGPIGGNWKITNGWAVYDATNSIWGMCTGMNSGYPFLLWQDPTGVGCGFPGPPTTPSATASGTSATVTWVAPTKSGNTSITSYTVTSSPDSRTCTATASERSCTVTGLTTGQSYSLTVTATNTLGTGAASTAVTVTPRVIPTEVIDGIPVAVEGNESALVSWTNKSSLNVTGYEVTASPGGSTCTAVTSLVSDPSCTVPNLVNGTSYTFTVKTTNSAGASLFVSSPSAMYVPRTFPSAPTSVQVLAGDESVLVTWMPPTNTGGTALTSYTATSNPGGHTCTATAPSTICFVPGLTNGQAYTFTVTARSAAFATVGESNASIASDSVTPLTTPGAPTFTSLTPGNGYLAASFSPPTSDGGSAITRYDYSVDNGAHWFAFGSVSTSAPQRITGLSTGVSYDVLIRAVNAAGAGPSTSAQTATFVTAPAAPSGVTGVAGDNGVALAWTAPTMTGGRALVSYTATALPGGASCTVLAPITTCDITGLTNGVKYTFTVTATNTIGTGTPSLATAAMKPISPAASNVTFEIVIAVVVGDPVAGGSAEFSSTGLEPSSPWDLIVRSTPRVLSSGTSGAAGTILGNAVIPTGLEAGWHSLTLSGRNYLGYQVSSTTWFEINASGELMGASSIDPKTLEQNRLAQTGQATREIALLAFALMAVGFVLTRRRTRQTT